MENNFEKHISDSMNNPPEIPFEDQLWVDMNSRLNAAEEQPKRRLFAGILPMALFSIIPFALASFFYVKHDEALTRIDRLEQLIKEQTTTGENAQVKAKQTVIIYDTIFNKVVMNEIVSPKNAVSDNTRNNRSEFSNAAQNLARPIFSDQLSNFSFFKNSKYTAGFESTEKSFAENYESDQLAGSESENDLSDIPFLPHNDYFINTDENLGELPAVSSKKRKRYKSAKYYLYKARPTHFALTASLGNYYDLNLKENTFELVNQIRSEIGYGENFSLVIGANYLKSKFEIEGKEGNELEDIMEYFPKLSDDPSDDLEEIYGYFNYLQVPFGLKYEFLSGRRFRPSISGGLITRMATRSSLRYEYDGAKSEAEENLLPGNFNLKAYWSSIGFRYLLDDKWSLNLETGAQIDLNPRQYKYENLQLLQWNAGVQYRIK